MIKYIYKTYKEFKRRNHGNNKKVTRTNDICY